MYFIGGRVLYFAVSYPIFDVYAIFLLIDFAFILKSKARTIEYPLVVVAPLTRISEVI